MSYNFSYSCMVLGAVALALHYEAISALNTNLAVPTIIGKPCSSKSTVCGLMLSTIGIIDENMHGNYLVLKQLQEVDK